MCTDGLSGSHIAIFQRLINMLLKKDVVSKLLCFDFIWSPREKITPNVELIEWDKNLVRVAFLQYSNLRWKIKVRELRFWNMKPLATYK